jgi:hypothetical protein
MNLTNFAWQTPMLKELMFGHGWMTALRAHINPSNLEPIWEDVQFIQAQR